MSQVIKDQNHDTGLAVISVDEKADNSIIIISGANMAMGMEDVEQAKPAMNGVKVVMLQLEIPVPTSVAVAKTA